MLEIYVSGSGSDHGNGSKEQPFRSIREAQAAVRSIVKEGAAAGVTVIVRGGTYTLDEPLRFGCGDADAERCPVIYRSAEGETAEFIGGMVLTAWEDEGDGLWSARVPKGVKFHTLYADGRRISKARMPDSGYYRSQPLEEDGRAGIRYREGEFPDIPHGDADGLQIYVWPGGGEANWFAETIPVADMDAGQRTIRFKRPSCWEIGEESRYYLQGSLAFLREPAQFHLDESAGVLYYRPRSESPWKEQVVAPLIGRILHIQGDSEEERASGLTFSGLTFVCTDFVEDFRMMREEPGMDNAEPDENRNGIVYLRDVQDIEISDSIIRNSGTCGVYLDRGVEGVRLLRNRVERVGHTGIYASGYAPGEGDFRDNLAPYRNKGHRIADNVITDGGELVGHGSGIVLYQSGDNEIAHNRIANMPRYGISMKGLRYQRMPSMLWETAVAWDNHYDFLYTRNNRICYNDLSNVMTDSQDGGMIESWGIGRGNVIHGNRLHHSGIHFSFGFGIYLDDATDDVEVTHNVIDHLYQTGEGKLWMAIFSKGIGNRIRNNLITNNESECAFGTQEMVGEYNRDIVIESNIVSNSGYMYAHVNWSGERLASADRNLYWRDGAAPLVTGELPFPSIGVSKVWGNLYAWESWRSLLEGKYDAQTLLAPAGFVDEAAGDYGLQPASPAYPLGWQDIDFSLIGPRMKPKEGEKGIISIDIGSVN
ncbi:right-handed parallel beta-helix repeat-containing protein [Paenibacillus glycanilyticus]|uniref:right-handed parallel beta-helix repeat-containing protein n=1 Tax=Paenibacillus glycanilyticus TaxID=126569 RepID=UPI00204029AE|nr:right-handed parallel beta-helix repeat-containing protein [Paenibacillus glycanilyticus]MCM3630807.1 right-handed parallel beta-helix repeat-containing protein [Paenibacillus glycanilyticus]